MTHFLKSLIAFLWQMTQLLMWSLCMCMLMIQLVSSIQMYIVHVLDGLFYMYIVYTYTCTCSRQWKYWMLPTFIFLVVIYTCSSLPKASILPCGKWLNSWCGHCACTCNDPACFKYTNCTMDYRPVVDSGSTYNVLNATNLCCSVICVSLTQSWLPSLAYAFLVVMTYFLKPAFFLWETTQLLMWSLCM